jgi:hypothetical protein
MDNSRSFGMAAAYLILAADTTSSARIIVKANSPLRTAANTFSVD